MKRCYWGQLLVAMFALFSCSNDEVVNTAHKTEQEAIVDGNVPLSRAVTNADFIFKNTEGSTSKQRKIQSVDVLTTLNINSNLAGTRSSLQNEQENLLAYIVNYENNEGFAILAANTKLPPVISIGDEGNFNTQGFIDCVQNNITRNNSELTSAQEVQYAIINNSLLLPSVDISDDPINCSDTTMILKCLPLVRTKWRQDDPYNYYSPIPSGSSYKSTAGCVPVAGAQTLAALCFHHNWRPTTQLSNEYHINWRSINKMIFDGIYKLRKCYR